MSKSQRRKTVSEDQAPEAPAPVPDAVPKQLHLEPCACGETPEGLIIQAQERAKYGMATGTCCRRWYVEFNNYYEQDQNLMLANAASAWNEAPRVVAAE